MFQDVTRVGFYVDANRISGRNALIGFFTLPSNLGTCAPSQDHDGHVTYVIRPGFVRLFSGRPFWKKRVRVLAFLVGA